MLLKLADVRQPYLGPPRNRDTRHDDRRAFLYKHSSGWGLPFNPTSWTIHYRMSYGRENITVSPELPRIIKRYTIHMFFPF
jgi:hypothetical protein